ncbi:hypothetical protein [Xylanimonas ulmi]|uniref:Uncharacterized protein n=1 Tax=Xylanimonas ulmi TaxID=228973 RepID=A0A4Q7M022_9MICO|nr:hypothetical protein [Xylanibacterium ulmi]RZS60461.1 hypothetical protein EV386_0719 [Xylanibacterium ulmi]
MAGGFKMQFVADVAPFLRGTKDVEGALGDVAGALDDLARDATKSGGKAADAMDQVGEAADTAARDVDRASDTASDSLKGIGDGAKSAAKEVDAQTDKAADSVEEIGDSAKRTRKVVDTETDQMGKSFKDVFDDAKTAGRTSLKSLADDVKDGAKDVSEGTETMKENAASNVKEMAASFQDAGSVVDGAAGFAAEALEGFGTAGVVAGAGLAIGLNVAYNKLQELADKANEFKENVGELGKAIAHGEYDPAEAFDEWATQLQDAKSWFELWQDEAVNNIEHVRDAAKKAGQDLGDMVAPLVSGDVEEAKANLADLRKEQERLTQVIADSIEVNADGYEVATDATKAAESQRDGVEDLIDVYEDEIKTLEAAHEQAVLYKMATEDLTEAEAELALKIDDVNRARDERVDANRSAVQAEWDMEDAVKATTDAIAEGVTKGRDAEKTLFDQAGKARDLAAAQEDLSGDTDDYNKVIDAQKRKFIENATQMGYTQQEAELLAQKYGLIQKVVDTQVNAHTAEAKAAIDDVKSRLDSLPLAKYITVGVLDNQGSAAATYSASGGMGGGTATKRGKATGGIIPGQPSTMDNTYTPTASGEFVVNAPATAKHRELLEAINQGRQVRAPQAASPVTVQALSDAQISALVTGIARVVKANSDAVVAARIESLLQG